ncbi:MAG: phenylalanine--tRNA ligase subunit beta, partial [Thermoleophilia bacterium]|nr:phenylalanine--tRNA ligase subunit beta [Thermoleophilia bacterium]
VPGRAAAVSAGEIALGWIGELHPLVARQFDLPQTVVAELSLQALATQLPAPVTYEQVSPFPPAREDIAVVVDNGLPAEQVLRVVRESGGELLAHASLFDVYEGEQIDAGSKSLAIRLVYSAPDRTLTDDEVTGARGKIVERLKTIGGSLRG